MTFEEIYDRACERHDADDLHESLGAPRTARTLKSRSDAYYLAEMTRRVFQSGFVWRIVEAKWAGFEEVFSDFDPNVVRTYDAEQVEGLMLETRIIRHRKKIDSTIANAQFICDVAAENGNFGTYLAQWKPTDFPGLFADLKKRGSRLGGMTGQYFLRFVGWDAPLMTRDVVAALIDADVVTKSPTSKADWAKVQAAFDTWHKESGQSYSAISKVLARSIDAVEPD